jgi:hypothetical protein
MELRGYMIDLLQLPPGRDFNLTGRSSSRTPSHAPPI